MQAIIQILQPLAGPKVGEAIRKTVNELFGVFAQSMSAAFQKFMRPDGTFPPRLGEPLRWPLSSAKCSQEHLTLIDEGEPVLCQTSACLPALLAALCGAAIRHVLALLGPFCHSVSLLKASVVSLLRSALWHACKAEHDP